MYSSNNLKRIKAIESYNLNPGICKSCGIVIVVKDNESPCKTKKKIFCSRSCSASFNNTGVCRHELSEKRFCICGNRKTRKSIKCKKCHVLELSVKDNPLSYFLKGSGYSSSKLTHVRKLAKEILENSSKEKICVFCKDPAFIPILEVGHIKSIMSFDKETSINIINNIDNLDWMCPNHHALYDKDLIQYVRGSAG